MFARELYSKHFAKLENLFTQIKIVQMSLAKRLHHFYSNPIDYLKYRIIILYTKYIVSYEQVLYILILL